MGSAFPVSADAVRALWHERAPDDRETRQVAEVLQLVDDDVPVDVGALVSVYGVDVWAHAKERAFSLAERATFVADTGNRSGMPVWRKSSRGTR